MKWISKQNLTSEEPTKRLKEILKCLLINRGITTKAAIHNFVHPPHPADIKIADLGINQTALTAALKRINTAIAQQESIVIFGDYDADGITATAIMWETLYGLKAKVIPFIPHREKHGYGLSIKAVDDVIEQHHPRLIITVDNGIVAHEAAEYVRRHNIDLIITDHHVATTTPPAALAILHSTQLAGAGVSWIVSREIIKSAKAKDWREIMAHSLDLATIGTVADQVSLSNHNRSLVKAGLEILRKTARVGLLELFSQAQFDQSSLSTYHINFVIAPRINAMGRLAHGLDSLRLLCTSNAEKARTLAHTLGDTNQERQDLTFELLQTAKNMVGTALDSIIVIDKADFHEGVIGLVAGKLAESFYRPSIVIGRGPEVSKASARSIAGVNIITLIRRLDHLLINAGGHPMAAGFTIETVKIEAFKTAITALANQSIEASLLEPSLSADVSLEMTDISWELLKLIHSLEPFGVDNQKPIFWLKDCPVLEKRTIGQEKKHLKLILPSHLKDQATIDALWFGHGGEIDAIAKRADMLVTLDENTWKGHSKLQLMIKDVKGSLEKEG